MPRPPEPPRAVKSRVVELHWHTPEGKVDVERLELTPGRKAVVGNKEPTSGSWFSRDPLSPNYITRERKFGLFVGMAGDGRVYVEPRHTQMYSMPSILRAGQQVHHDKLEQLSNRRLTFVDHGDHVVVAGRVSGTVEPGGVRYDRTRGIWVRPSYSGGKPEHVHSFVVKMPRPWEG